MPDSRTLQPGQSVGGGRFTLVRALGRGGMGVVWLAQDTRLGEEVALKFLPPEVAADPVALNDLRRETVRSHKLTHPNIVRIHDLQEQSDGVAFISMEYVDGPTLSAWRLEQVGQVLTWDQLAPLVQQLCAALDYAHGEGVIHRDLKPANVMLDGKGRLKLADFGIAAVVSDSVSRVSKLGTSGTLAYMSPQQLTGKRPCVTDDIYALGATLYELLTSQPPFYTGDITHQVLHEPPEPPTERLAALGIQNEVLADVGAIIMACLAKDPAQRPQSAGAVAGWIGLEVVSKSSVESLAETMFVKSEASQAEAELQAPISEAPAPMAAARKLAWAASGVVAVLLLLVAGVWYFGKRRAGETQQPVKVTEVIANGQTSAAGPDSSAPAINGATSSATNGSEDGFVSLFNGRDFTGWHWRPRFPADLSVKDGALNIEIDGTKGHWGGYLDWTNGAAHDFELRFQCRFSGGVGINRGYLRIFYRDFYPDFTNSAPARPRGAYFTQLCFDPTTCGSIFQSMGPNKGANILAQPSQRRTLRPNEPRQQTPITDRISPAEVVKTSFKQFDWNEVMVLADGPHISVKINGVTTAELFDEDPKNGPAGRTITLDVHREQAEIVRAQFRDIRLKRLTQGIAASRSTSLEAAASAIVPEVKEFIYKQTPQGALKMYVHHPLGWKSSDHRPAAVFFFGGGWDRGSVEEFRSQAEYLASRGMVTARADYRVKSRHKVTPDKSVEDAKSAIRWLRSNASQLGIDTAQIVAAGASAGGHLAAASALIPGFNDPSNDQLVSCRPNALVLYNPVVSHNVSGLEVTNSTGKNIEKEFWPTLFLSKQAPPTILFYGTSDAHLAQGREYRAKATLLGVRAEFFVAANQAHGFFHQPPWDELTLIETDRFLTSLGYLKGEPKVKVPVGTESKLQRE